ncbi:TPA: hypothetical protein ACH3X1_007824 [Trebouxia sp. C0004]
MQGPTFILSLGADPSGELGSSDAQMSVQAAHAGTSTDPAAKGDPASQAAVSRTGLAPAKQVPPVLQRQSAPAADTDQAPNPASQAALQPQPQQQKQASITA